MPPPYVSSSLRRGRIGDRRAEDVRVAERGGALGLHIRCLALFLLLAAALVAVILGTARLLRNSGSVHRAGFYGTPALQSGPD